MEVTDNQHIKGANQTKKMISGESGQSSLPVQLTKKVFVYSVAIIDCDGRGRVLLKASVQSSVVVWEKEPWRALLRLTKKKIKQKRGEN